MYQLEGVVSCDSSFFIDLLDKTLEKERKLIKNLIKDSDGLTLAKNIRMALREELNFLLIYSILNRENISFTELTEKFNINPSTINSRLARLSDLGLIDTQFKKNSPLQAHYKVSENGKKILWGFGVDKENIRDIDLLVKERKIKSRIDQIIP